MSHAGASGSELLSNGVMAKASGIRPTVCPIWVVLHRSVSEDINLVVYSPARGIIKQLSSLRPSGNPRAAHVLPKSVSRFSKSCLLSRPIVHLDVDVCMIVAAPCRRQLLSPAPLQVSRQRVVP